MKYVSFSVLILIFSSCAGTKGNITGIENKVEKRKTEKKLVWSDEFDYDGLPDSTKWTYDVGNGCPDLCGWGNNQLEYYSDRELNNSRVENGHLIIEARKEKKAEMEYTSARLVTRGKGDWKYGKIEIRADLPTGVGTWPAIWLLPSDRTIYGDWPACGEIDLMEHVGYNPDSIFGTIHTESYNHMIATQKGGKIKIADAESNFHIYGLNWTEDKMEWLIDGEKYFEFTNENKSYKEWPFDQSFYLILNIAVGGGWGGTEGVHEDIWPQQMIIDYVRVYQES